MDDLIERLRARRRFNHNISSECLDHDCQEAADRIAALEAQLADAKTALTATGEAAATHLKRAMALEADNARLKRHIKSNTEMRNADYAIAQKLIADNARLMGLVKEAYLEGWRDGYQADECKPDSFGDWLVSTTLAKIKEATDA